MTISKNLRRHRTVKYSHLEILEQESFALQRISTMRNEYPVDSVVLTKFSLRILLGAIEKLRKSGYDKFTTVSSFDKRD